MKHPLFRVFLPAYLAIVVDAMGYGIVYPLMTELFAGEQGVHMAAGLSLTLRHFYLGLSFLLYPLAALFGSAFMTDLSKIYGRKTVLILCLSGICISFFLMGLGVELFSISLLLIGRALSGLMAGSQPIAQAAIIEASSPGIRSKNIGIMTFILSVGIVMGPFIGGIFSDRSLSPLFRLSTPFYIASGLSLITLVWVASSFPKKQLETFLKWTQPIKNLIEGFTSKQVRYLALIFFLMQLGFSLFFQLIQVFVSTVFDFPSWELGIFNAYLGVAFVIVVLLGMKNLLKFLKIEHLATFSLLLTGAFLILPMLFSDQIFVWIASFLAAGFNMIAYGALLNCFSRSVNQELQGWAVGVFGAIISLGWTVTGFSTNLIQFIGLHWLISIGGFFMLLAAFLMSGYNLPDYDQANR